MYDYPQPPSSSTPPSPRSPRKNAHRRSQSPLPHLATLLPSSNHHHHQYSPSSRAADISRLLDPAYASSSSSSSMSASPSSHAQTRAYVDHRGDLHDPDYRDFPVLRATARPNQLKQRRTSAGSATRSRSHDRYPIAMHPPRPSWERDWGTEMGDSDDENDDGELDSQSHFSPFVSHHTSRKNTNTSQSAFGLTSYSPNYYYFPDASTTSPLGSYEDEPSNALQLHESPFGEDDTDEVIEESRKPACLVRKGPKPKKAASLPPQTEKDLYDESSSSFRSLDEELEDVHTTTPTCTHVLRQQWQAMTLRIRFGVFHAKRRLRRRT